METAALNRYHSMTTTAKATTALAVPSDSPITRMNLFRSAISSALCVLSAKLQPVIWSVLNNRFDELIGPALALLKIAAERGTETNQQG